MKTFTGKPCIRCKQTERFVRSLRCVSCQRLRSNAWAKANRAKASQSQNTWRKTSGGKRYDQKVRLALYGLTPQDYDDLLQKQDYRCKICGNTGTKKLKYLVIDHCHSSGKVRGLLCNKCNIGLGCFDDSLELLGKSQKYLADSQV